MGRGERAGKEGENRVDRLASYTALMASGSFQGQPAPTATHSHRVPRASLVHVHAEPAQGLLHQVLTPPSVWTLVVSYPCHRCHTLITGESLSFQDLT